MSGSTTALLSSMYGPGAMQPARPLFADAPVQQLQPGQPAIMPQSLAASLMRGAPMPQMQPPQIPLSSMMAMRGQQSQFSTPSLQASTPGLSWNPMNPVGTESLGGNTANQGTWLGNVAAAMQNKFGLS